MKQTRRLLAMLLVCCALRPASALVIEFNWGTSISSNTTAQAAFEAAAARWSSVLTDSVTVKLDVDLKDMDPGVLGGASPDLYLYSYAAAKSALIGDALSTNDQTAIANLPGDSDTFDLLINHTAENGNSATPYYDDDDTGSSVINNSLLMLTQANARALGLYSGLDADAKINFNTDYTFDFDPSDGITAGAFDFVGIATHEIGHALGFISGVDYLEYYAGNPESSLHYVTSMDLYRYSSSSAAQGVIDWTAGTSYKYCSIDGGTTDLGAFSLGKTYGDGRQASHWKDNLGLGIMDPTVATGELLSVSSLDLTMFDVIGWDLYQQTTGPTSTPEPGTLALLASGVVCLRRRRRQEA